MSQRVSYDGHISEELFHQMGKKTLLTWERITGKVVNDIFLEEYQERVNDIVHLGEILRTYMEQLIISQSRIDKVMRVIKIYLRLIFLD